ncbi:MAG: hypothetical protein FH753_12575 [Firmicutes bacterium]|nr:hypothetical protein [Bacillota bacterium]
MVDKLKVKEIDKSINYLKATMSYENLDLPDDMVKMLRRYLTNQCTNKEARENILKKYKSEKV